MRQTFVQSSDPNVPLSLEQVARVAPAAFNGEAHSSRSSRFTAVPTNGVLRSLMAEGFAPFYAAQTITRDPSRQHFTRHMLRLRPVGGAVARAVNDVFPEVVITNANDGSAAYRMMAGLFRLLCLNGAVVSTATVAEVHVRHTGDIIGQIIEGAYTVVREFPKLEERVQRWSRIPLPHEWRLNFAHSALRLKYSEGGAPVTAEEVLRVRRHADSPTDLWTVFNVVQENLVRGGLYGRNANGRRLTTRPIVGIQQNVDLNRRLWALAESYAEAA